MEKPSSRADADGGGGFVSSTVRFFLFLHTRVFFLGSAERMTSTRISTGRLTQETTV